MICALALREVETDVREDLDRGIEQRCALDALRVEHGELEDQSAAERTNKSQCLCFSAEPQAECGRIPGRLLQDDRL